MRYAFAMLVALSAFLLFVIQPAAGKRLLVVMGGTPSVWTTVLVFFQVVVVAGYGLSLVLAQWRNSVGAALVPIGLVAAGFLVRGGMPLGELQPPPSSQVSNSPVFWILLELCRDIGCAVVAIATTSTLLQVWFTRREGGRDPVWLYAASNAGSLGALVIYVIGVEPFMALESQGRWWHYGLLLWAGWLLAVAFTVANKAPEIDELVMSPSGPAPTRIKHWEWLFLGAVPSFFLMASTRHLVTDVAPIPMLGLMPLALFLIAYILAFSLPCLRILFSLQVLASIALMLVESMGATDTRMGGAALVIFIHLAGFFLVTWAALTGQAASRPANSYLARFYLTTAIGGALGGLAQAVVAPVVFRFVGDWDYPLGLAAMAFARPVGWQWAGWRHLAVGLACGLLSIAVSLACPWEAGPWRDGITRGLPLVVAYCVVSRAPSWPICLAFIFLVGIIVPADRSTTLFLERGFFGTTRVSQEYDAHGLVRKLYHGTTVHGICAPDQTDAMGRPLPLAYYHAKGPAGSTLLRMFPKESAPMRCAVVGLGAGSLAWYARPNDRWIFYEIDPVVVRAATRESLFPYLTQCLGDWSIVEADGRKGLELHEGDHFDVIVMDAFSSDSIPTHLLTREALAAYRSRLKPDGIMLFHVSNRYLDLSPVLAVLAHDAGMSAWQWADLMGSSGKDEVGKSPSEWVVISGNTAAFTSFRGGWSRLQHSETTHIWTDRHSSVLSAWRTNSID